MRARRSTRQSCTHNVQATGEGLARGARRAAADIIDLAVWVHAPRATRLARDDEAARADWDRWMAEEDERFRLDRTLERCDVLVDGAPRIAHDPERFVRLRSCAYE